MNESSLECITSSQLIIRLFCLNICCYLHLWGNSASEQSRRVFLRASGVGFWELLPTGSGTAAVHRGQAVLCVGGAWDDGRW